MQTTYLKQGKTLITLIESIYESEVLFDNVPIWQLFADNLIQVLCDEHYKRDKDGSHLKY
jgi:hypothetical protein